MLSYMVAIGTCGELSAAGINAGYQQHILLASPGSVESDNNRTLKSCETIHQVDMR